MKWNRNEPDTLSQVPPVLRIGITGGIGSGKSYVCRQLEAVGHEVFYCDEEAKRIIRHDATVQQALAQHPGIRVVLDVHRDAIEKNGAAVAAVNGEGADKTAQVMLICGCDNKPRRKR